MKKYYFLLLLFFVTFLSFSQNNLTDVIYLKNGSIINGVIVELIPDTSVKIMTNDNNIFVFQMNEVERITKSGIVMKEEKPKNSGLSSGYRGIIENGIQVGVGDFSQFRIKIDFINGVQINPHVFLGFGTGIRYYIDYEDIMLPLFVDFRSYFINHRVSPYVSFGLGYTINASQNLEGMGMLINPAVGVNIRVSPRNAINVSMGYEIQKIDKSNYLYYYYLYYNYYYDDPNDKFGSQNAITINLGFSF